MRAGLVVVGGLVALGAAGLAWAQAAGGDFVITRQVIAGGGAVATGDATASVSTIGQPAPGTSSGGDFVLRGGFHLPTPASDGAIFRDGFEGAVP